MKQTDEIIYKEHCNAIDRACNHLELNEAIKAIDDVVFDKPAKFKQQLLLRVVRAFKLKFNFTVNHGVIMAMLPTWYPRPTHCETCED